ncbi:MAG: hypothetical protein PVH48_07310 [Cyclobacteriaceae bacterium]
MEKIAEDIGGQFSEYDKYKSVIIVPLEENRYQAVVGVLKHSEKLNKTRLEFSSKVCQLSESVDLKELLMENAKTCYARFVIVDDYVRVEGSAFLESLTESGIKEIIDEVARMADAWELKLTGMDVH